MSDVRINHDSLLSSLTAFYAHKKKGKKKGRSRKFTSILYRIVLGFRMHEISNQGPLAP